jgi:hypothetical protein
MGAEQGQRLVFRVRGAEAAVLGNLDADLAVARVLAKEDLAVGARCDVRRLVESVRLPARHDGLELRLRALRVGQGLLREGRAADQGRNCRHEWYSSRLRQDRRRHG